MVCRIILEIPQNDLTTLQKQITGPGGTAPSARPQTRDAESESESESPGVVVASPESESRVRVDQAALTPTLGSLLKFVALLAGNKFISRNKFSGNKFRKCFVLFPQQ